MPEKSAERSTTTPEPQPRPYWTQMGQRCLSPSLRAAFCTETQNQAGTEVSQSIIAIAAFCQSSCGLMTQRWSYLDTWPYGCWIRLRGEERQSIQAKEHYAHRGGGNIMLWGGGGGGGGAHSPLKWVWRAAGGFKTWPCHKPLSAHKKYTLSQYTLIKSFIKILLQYCTPQLEPVLLLFYSKKKWKTQNLFRHTPRGGGGGGGYHPTHTAVGAEILPRACHKHTVAGAETWGNTKFLLIFCRGGRTITSPVMVPKLPIIRIRETNYSYRSFFKYEKYGVKPIFFFFIHTALLYLY